MTQLADDLDRLDVLAGADANVLELNNRMLVMVDSLSKVEKALDVACLELSGGISRLQAAVTRLQDRRAARMAALAAAC